MIPHRLTKDCSPYLGLFALPKNNSPYRGIDKGQENSEAYSV